MTHPNDTLNGRLFAYELEDQKHLRHSTGYWRMVEERMIRSELEAEGVEPTVFRVSARVVENHRNDITYRETSRKFASRAHREANSLFSRDELTFLAAHFEGANDPTAQAILAKVREGLLPASRCRA